MTVDLTGTPAVVHAAIRQAFMASDLPRKAGQLIPIAAERLFFAFALDSDTEYHIVCTADASSFSLTCDAI